MKYLIMRLYHINNMLILISVLLCFSKFTEILCAQKTEKIFYTVDREECYQSFKTNYKNIDIIAPQCYRMDESGTIWGTPDPRVMELSKKHNIKVMPLIMNPFFNQPMFHKFLQDPSAITRAIKTMVDLCKANNYYGIQFDYENILITDKDSFTEFYRKTANALHSNGFIISIAAVPRKSDYPGPTTYHKWIYEYWRGVYDYKALGEIGDFISFMTYDQHTFRTPPGPVAGIPWMEDCLKYILKDVPPEKISLGIPFYSMYWHPNYEDERAFTWGSSLPYSRAKGLAERNKADLIWSEKEKVYYTFYEDNGLYEYIYFEEVKAFKSKLELLKKYNLRGFSVWRLGDEDPEVWNIIK